MKIILKRLVSVPIVQKSKGYKKEAETVLRAKTAKGSKQMTINVRKIQHRVDAIHSQRFEVKYRHSMISREIV